MVYLSGTEDSFKLGDSCPRTSTIYGHLMNYSFRVFDLHLFICNLQKDDIKSFLLAMSMLPVRSSILYTTSQWSKSEETLVEAQLQGLAKQSMFYLAVPSTSGVNWYQVLTLRSGYAMNKLQFFWESSKIIEDYDLNGLTIYSIALDWEPFATFKGCNSEGKECSSSGYLIDFVDILSK